MRTIVHPESFVAMLALTLLSVPLAPQGAPGQEVLDCRECHECERPSRTNPCLKPSTCPRHEVTAELESDLGPDVAILDELENLYVPVHFDHKAHAQMVRLAEGCETCHHYTPPNSPHPGCKDCHPAEIAHEDIAQPGLKGAYHRNCMTCHEEWDTDTACEVCHERKGHSTPVSKDSRSVPEHSYYEPIPLLDMIIFDTEYEEGDQVPFHHRNHSELYERDCAECHHEQGCNRCHVHGQRSHPMGAPAETDLHDTCFACHKEERCEDCHGRSPDDLFSHASTGWPLAVYHSNLRCRSCHGQRGSFMKLVPRGENCHPGGWNAATFRHEVTGISLDDVHQEADCVDCHEGGWNAPPTCAGCHEDDRHFDAKRGFEG